MNGAALAHGLVLVLALLTGCRSPLSTVCHLPVHRGAVGHVVIFWFKEPGNADARQRVIEASRSFGDIPGVERVEVGEMLPSPRPNVDSSYDVAVVIRFRDGRALLDFQSHPEHQAALNEMMPLVERVVVYDFVIDPGPAQK